MAVLLQRARDATLVEVVVKKEAFEAWEGTSSPWQCCNTTILTTRPDMWLYSFMSINVRSVVKCALVSSLCALSYAKRVGPEKGA